MGALQVTVGLWLTVLPFAVLGSWIAVALWDLAARARDGELGRGGLVGWTAAVLAVPVAGAAVYLLAGGGRVARSTALTYVVGGVAAYLVVLVLAAAIGAAG